ncbi:hypothetical protein FQZ97_1208850 [compost metagenome]
MDGIGHKGRAGEFVDAIGGEQEHIARLQLQRLIVDFQVGIDAEGTAEVAFVLGNPQPMILGQLLQAAAA